MSAKTKKKPHARNAVATEPVVKFVETLAEQNSEALLRTIFRYVECVVIPQKLADIRRRNGDPTASPKDYFCRCPVPFPDAMPDCWPHKNQCRFRDRIRPRPKNRLGDFGHKFTQQTFREIVDKFRKMDCEEQWRFLEKVMIWFRQEKKRNARPRETVEAAPLREDFRVTDGDA